MAWNIHIGDKDNPIYFTDDKTKKSYFVKDTLPNGDLDAYPVVKTRKVKVNVNGKKQIREIPYVIGNKAKGYYRYDQFAKKDKQFNKLIGPKKEVGEGFLPKAKAFIGGVADDLFLGTNDEIVMPFNKDLGKNIRARKSAYNDRNWGSYTAGQVGGLVGGAFVPVGVGAKVTKKVLWDFPKFIAQSAKGGRGTFRLGSKANKKIYDKAFPPQNEILENIYKTNPEDFSNLSNKIAEKTARQRQLKEQRDRLLGKSPTKQEVNEPDLKSIIHKGVPYPVNKISREVNELEFIRSKPFSESFDFRTKGLKKQPYNFDLYGKKDFDPNAKIKYGSIRPATLERLGYPSNKPTKVLRKDHVLKGALYGGGYGLGSADIGNNTSSVDRNNAINNVLLGASLGGATGVLTPYLSRLGKKLRTTKKPLQKIESIDDKIKKEMLLSDDILEDTIARQKADRGITVIDFKKINDKRNQIQSELDGIEASKLYPENIEARKQFNIARKEELEKEFIKKTEYEDQLKAYQNNLRELSNKKDKEGIKNSINDLKTKEKERLLKVKQQKIDNQNEYLQKVAESKTNLVEKKGKLNDEFEDTNYDLYQNLNKIERISKDSAFKQQEYEDLLGKYIDKLNVNPNNLSANSPINRTFDQKGDYLKDIIKKRNTGYLTTADNVIPNGIKSKPGIKPNPLKRYEQKQARLNKPLDIETSDVFDSDIRKLTDKAKVKAKAEEDRRNRISGLIDVIRRTFQSFRIFPSDERKFIGLLQDRADNVQELYKLLEINPTWGRKIYNKMELKYPGLAKSMEWLIKPSLVLEDAFVKSATTLPIKIYDEE